ncbi:MAG: DUF4838 domain-containing protein [bacterium]
MRTVRKAIVAGVLGILVAGSRLHGAEALTLVADGVPTCIIVVDDGVSISEKHAAFELQRYLKQMSGAEVETLTPEKAAPSKAQNRIVVGGRTAKALGLDVNLVGLGTDGYVLQTTGNTLVVAGGEKRGTLYGAYDVLYALGCRWWAVDANTIPAKKTIATGPMNVRKVPVVEFRDMLYGDRQWVSQHEFGASYYSRVHMNGFNYSECPEYLGGRLKFSVNLVHSWNYLMRPVGDLDGSFAKHPEYWAFTYGKRQATQPCPMHPKVVEIMTANALKELRENPDYLFIVVGQEDNMNYCTCDDCAAVIKAEESPAGPGLILANKIAEAIEKEFPKVWVMAPAYEWSQKPPKNLKPRHNVGITLCSIRCDFNRPIEERTTEQNKIFADDLVAWGKIAKKIYIWDYTTNFYHYLMPFPNLDVLVANTQFYVKNGVRGILYQGSHTTQSAEFSQLRMWVLARAAWDPEKADGPALINEFLEGYYGPAAGHIKKYIDLIHSYGRAHPEINVNIGGGLSGSPWLSPETVAAAEPILQAAEAAVAGDPVFSKRVRHAHFPIQYVLLKRGVHSSTWEVANKSAPLSLPLLAEAFNKNVKDSGIFQIGEFQDIAPLCKWVTDYASHGAPVPAELKGVDPATFKLLQACQMDNPGTGHWKQDPDATDGWGMSISHGGWIWSHTFNTPLDLKAGSTYKVFLRLKAPPELKGDENVVMCGVQKPNTASHYHAFVKGGQLEPGKFKVAEAGQFVATEGGMQFFMCMASPQTLPSVLLDCLWLQEVPAAKP